MNEKPEWLKLLTNLPEINMNMKFFGGHRQKVTFDWVAKRERHFAFEILLILDGVQKTEFDNRTYHFYQDDIVLIPPGISHENTCVSKEGMEYFCVHFDIDDPEIQQNLLMYCPILLSKTNIEYERIKDNLTNYVNLLKKDDFSLREKLLIEQWLIELILALLDYTTYERNEMEKSDNVTLILVKTIADTIQQNFIKFTEYPLEENLSLLSVNQIADKMNISESTMLKAFKKVYSISPKQYLDQLRYNEAKFLLHQPNLSINEIAEIVGYQNLSHFSRQFKKWSSLSPNQYRKLNN